MAIDPKFLLEFLTLLTPPREDNAGLSEAEAAALVSRDPARVRAAIKTRATS